VFGGVSLLAIRDKLDAANRTHAVVKAMRRRYWIDRLLKKNQRRAFGAQIHVTSGVNTMSHITYKIVQHDGGWAYKVVDDPSGHWRQEIAPGNDRPETDVED
jgi:hypothetical protein